MSVVAIISSIWRRSERHEAMRRNGAHQMPFSRDCCMGRVYVDTLGLDGNLSFHNLPRGSIMRDPPERAVLAQTQASYVDLCGAMPEAKLSLGDGTMPSFGENFILSGVSGKDLCIGDVFRSDNSSLTLQVSCPRYGCTKVDHRHPINRDLVSGKMGTMRHFVNATGHGRVFFRVLTAGDAGQGDCLELTHRPYPQFSLEYLCKTTFPLAGASCLVPTWNGSPEELQELCELNELAFFEWKDVYHGLRAKGVSGINIDALSGNGTIENVGIKIHGRHCCPKCKQKFDTERASCVHQKFVHEVTQP